MRGNPHGCRGGRRHSGPIPAHAGQPPSRPRRPQTRRAYPRACGATLTWSDGTVTTSGLSPRMRGNPVRKVTTFTQIGPIPAHAGQPSRGPPSSRRRGAYPRACGATEDVQPVAAAGDGLSPRMRGNLPVCSVPAGLLGPIPAHAGQPGSRVPDRESGRAYPRACGATSATDFQASCASGLSPRMRGNPWRRIWPCEPKGPIPAHAGQPRSADPR